MNIADGLVRAFNDGYEQGKADAEAYLLHCGDTDEPQTNGDRIRAKTDEELAKLLFERGNCGEYCYGICSYQDECNGYSSENFCISKIVEWMKKEVEE